MPRTVAAAVVMPLTPTPLISLSGRIVTMMPRHDDLVVPALLHEVDLTATGVVLAAMLGPVLRMARRHMQVQRSPGRDAGTRAMDDDRIAVDEPGLAVVTDFDVSVKAGLTDTPTSAAIAVETISAAASAKNRFFIADLLRITSPDFNIPSRRSHLACRRSAPACRPVGSLLLHATSRQ
jgi:hypothetical protein